MNLSIGLTSGTILIDIPVSADIADVQAVVAASPTPVPDITFILSGHSQAGSGGGDVVGVGVVGVGVVGVGVGVGSSSPPQAINETSDTTITRANKTNSILLFMGSPP